MFDVNPDQIEALDSKELVILLRRLLHAEALASGLQLANVSVPLQITVADGGEDGRITWTGALDSTDFLPSRSNFFQCKASKIGRSGWKKECWAKATQKKNAKRALTPALMSIIAGGGSYIGFTIEALTGEKRDDHIKAINEGIVEAGGDPTKLAEIRLYDANSIASWAEHHPSVAIWLAEKTNRQSLAGYRTLEAWGTRRDFAETAYVDDVDPRYLIGSSKERDSTGADNRVNAMTACAKILDYVAEPRRLVRVVGASGLGKSRFVYESLRASSTQLGEIFKSSAVFADYRVVAASLLGVAIRLAESGKRTLLIVDECPRDIAIRLATTAEAMGSELRVITIDTDDRPLEEGKAFQVSLVPSEKPLLETIIRKRKPGIDKDTTARLSAICGGYPRFAILATEDGQNAGLSNVETIADVVERILQGANFVGQSEVRALESLAMFERVGIEADPGRAQLDLVAERLGRMSGDEMYEHLAKARSHDLVGQNGNNLTAQPSPVANHLASRLLGIIRPSLLDRLMGEAPDDLLLALLARWRYLDTLPTVIETSARLVRDQLDDIDKILSARGCAVLDALVHIVPDRVADVLQFSVLPLSDAELSLGKDARRNLVEALSKLAFRSRSFGVAARLLLRLAANETEDWANNATGHFKQLFQLELSGTEVPPSERFIILDEGIERGDPATLRVCVDALSSVFIRVNMRLGDSGRIGSGAPLVDWSPKTWDEVHEFYRDCLTRLISLRRKHPEFAKRCEEILTAATRRMLNTGLYEEFGELLMEIAAEKGFWPEAVESVGDWLYFDRKGAPADQGTFVRELYDRLFPADPINRAIIFTKFWRSDIRDPDAIYAESDSDFDYSERAARDIAVELAADDALVLEAIRRMAPFDLKNAYPFAEELGFRAPNKASAFETALDIAATKTGSLNMLRGLLAGVDRADRKLADGFLEKALATLSSETAVVGLHTALAMNSERLKRVIVDVVTGKIPPGNWTVLSYGRGLDELDVEDVARLISPLSSQGGDGAWAALEVAMMYRYGKPATAPQAHYIASLLTNPLLLEHSSNSQRDGHTFEDLLKRVRSTIGIDAALADSLSALIMNLVGSKNYELFSALDDTMRTVVGILRDDAPAVLWSQITHFYETSTPIERNRLKRLIGPANDKFDGRETRDAGMLFGVPQDLVFEWADGSADRPGLIVDFYPILSEANEKEFVWHPAMEIVAERYGKSKEFQSALSMRLRPSSWSGSIVPLLEVYLSPLQRWFNHPVRALSIWARGKHRLLERQIEIEKQRESS
ncbi:hypothetical protein [Rhizobium leguminosarum]|uniref:hypothetical protein n=1 Tax=Rhizobium leguminosarum TaxID=384 RepID=UPI000B925A6B|nr:hypothetical protein [Rhizobium leguminosarum]ASS60324.1 hypothetical protein CHR56_38045 [Rhizobium leguminosarum bv. viciae]